LLRRRLIRSGSSSWTRDGHQHLAFGAAARLVATRTKDLLLSASQTPGTEHHAAFEHDGGGHEDPSLAAVEGNHRRCLRGLRGESARPKPKV
jgi:hypothetical protein